MVDECFTDRCKCFLYNCIAEERGHLADDRYRTIRSVFLLLSGTVAIFFIPAVACDAFYSFAKVEKIVRLITKSLNNAQHIN